MNFDKLFKLLILLLLSIFVGVYSYNTIYNDKRYYLSEINDRPIKVIDTKTGIVYTRDAGNWIVIDYVNHKITKKPSK